MKTLQTDALTEEATCYYGGGCREPATLLLSDVPYCISHFGKEYEWAWEQWIEAASDPSYLAFLREVAA